MTNPLDYYECSCGHREVSYFRICPFCKAEKRAVLKLNGVIKAVLIELIRTVPIVTLAMLTRHVLPYNNIGLRECITHSQLIEFVKELK